MPARRRLDVGAPLEPDRRFRLQPEPLARAAHRRRLEAGALERDPRRARARSPSRARPSRRQAPRLATQSAMTSISGSSARVDAVERRRDVRPPGAADHQRPAVETIEIERVHRLPELEHHVVGDVHDVADRPHAGRLETFRQPARRRPDRHLEHLRAVARAELAVFEADLELRWRRAPGAPAAGRASISGRRSGRPQIVAASRAMPTWLRQSGRFAVISKSMTGSARRSRPRRPRSRAAQISRATSSTSAGRSTSSDEPGQDDLHSGNCSRKRRSFS